MGGVVDDIGAPAQFRVWGSPDNAARMRLNMYEMPAAPVNRGCAGSGATGHGPIKRSFAVLIILLSAAGKGFPSGPESAMLGP